MSYEGYNQYLCEEGHYWALDVRNANEEFSDNKCPKCKGQAVWYNMVDLTNGSYDEENNRIDNYIELEVKEREEGVCSNCGKKHLCKITYKIPQEEKCQ